MGFIRSIPNVDFENSRRSRRNACVPRNEWRPRAQPNLKWTVQIVFKVRDREMPPVFDFRCIFRAGNLIGGEHPRSISTADSQKAMLKGTAGRHHGIEQIEVPERSIGI